MTLQVGKEQEKVVTDLDQKQFPPMHESEQLPPQHQEPLGFGQETMVSFFFHNWFSHHCTGSLWFSFEPFFTFVIIKMNNEPIIILHLFVHGNYTNLCVN